jgi:hypothetical protein
MVNPNPIFVVSNSEDEIDKLVVEGGYCPVECSIGGESVVDDMELDHHGEYSHLPGVAIAGYTNYYGQRADRPFFVTCAPVDADSCFATAAVLGLLPHPSKDGPPWHQTDLTELAETINVLDLDPIGVNPLDLPQGDLVLAWNILMSGNNTSNEAYAAGAHLWAQLTTAQGHRLKPMLAGVAEAENLRRADSKQELSLCLEEVFAGKVACLAETKAWGFDVWYWRNLTAAGPEDLAGWRHPVVLALGAQNHEITIGCPNVAVAEILFGKGGLKNVFSQLAPEGWGGREAIGGSPRGQVMTTEQLLAAGKKVGEIVEESLGRA